MAKYSRLHIQTPIDFRLTSAVTSYGFYQLAPHRWAVDTQTLETCLHVDKNMLVRVAVQQIRPKCLSVQCDTKMTRQHQQVVRQQLARMLRLNESLADWYRIFPKAKRKHFGRLFRGATLFEDIVRTITTCNAHWRNTIRMNKLLCECIGKGAFPTPHQLVSVPPEQLQAQCKLGYRAARIAKLARDVVHGRIDLLLMESEARSQISSDRLMESLLLIEGVGPYAASNILQLLGRYDHLAIDSEAYRHIREQEELSRETPSSVLDQALHERYAVYAPYQFLAYWFELWHGVKSV